MPPSKWPAPVRAAPALLVALVLLAGCSGAVPEESTTPSASASGTPTTTAAPPPTTPPAGPPPPPASGKMTIYGVVVDAAVRPVQANITLVETRDVQHGSRFRFDGLDAGTYFLRFEAPGFIDQTLPVTPQDAKRELHVVLEAKAVVRLDHVTVHHHGIAQCWVEVLIIPAQCDYALTAAGQDPVFNTTNAFQLTIESGWRTVVGDLEFGGNPGFDGLRVRVDGGQHADGLGTYEQYARFNASESFTFRLEPGETYPDGVAPVPANTTVLQFTVYPQSHLWHATCEGEVPGPCALGVGGGIDVEFDLYLTTFYANPAPPGWSLANV